MPGAAAAQSVTKVKGEQFLRSATLLPTTVNAEKRTVDVRFTTGHRGRRATWFSDYDEELAVDEKSVRLERLNSGAPFLDNHRSWDLRFVIGVVERAWIQNGEGYATVRFDESPEADLVFGKIQRGILRNVSVGYLVHRYEDITKPDDKRKTYRTTDWEPVEISVVPVGFDPGAQFRDAGEIAYEIEIVSRDAGTNGGSEQMPPVNNENQERGEKGTDPEAAKNPAAAVDLEGEKKRAAEAARVEERKRTEDILALCRKHSLDDDFARDLVSRGVSVVDAKDAVLEKLAERSEKTKTNPGHRVEVGEDNDVQSRAVGIESAILHRVDPTSFELAEQGRKYRYMSLYDMAREFARSKGADVENMTKMEVVDAALSRGGGMHSTSDFPYILANAVRKRLRQAYDAAPSTWQPWCRIVEVPDFKSNDVLQFGEAPQLKEVPEHGEFTRGTIGEAKESYALKTYGRVVAITRQVIINDDLRAFDRIPMMFGRAAADLESDTVYAILTGNPKMSDNVDLFHSTHKNLGSAAAISDATIGEARKLMRTQKGLDGKITLNIIPKFLIVSAAKEALALRYLSTELLPDSASNVNPWKGTLTPIVEARLDAYDSGKAYFFSADPGQIDTIEVAYLQGQRGVFIEQRQGFDVDGLEVKCRLDFAAKAIDHRGLVKNAGA